MDSVLFFVFFLAKRIGNSSTIPASNTSSFNVFFSLVIKCDSLGGRTI